MTAVKRLNWTKRRARRLQIGFGVSRQIAIYCANEDWLAFAGRGYPCELSWKGMRTLQLAQQHPTAPRRSCAALGVCQTHATGRAACDGCPYRNLPQNVPPVPAIADTRLPRATQPAAHGWRGAWAMFRAWISGPTPW